MSAGCSAAGEWKAPDNFLLMGCVLAFTETLKSQLSSPYFHEKAWERGGKVYESVGINLYRKLLVGIGWEKLHKQSKPVRKNIDALRFLHYKTKQDELAHLIIFIIVLGFGIFVAFKFGVVYSLWLFILNILLNLFPFYFSGLTDPGSNGPSKSVVHVRANGKRTRVYQ